MIQAVIDIGTNTFNLAIADTVTGEVFHKEKQAVRLGKGGISKGIITEDATDRAIKSLLNYRNTIDKHGVSEVVVTATSAVRNAENQEEFLQRIFEETGLDIQVLSGQEEADLIYQGVCSYLEIKTEAELIVDIGGGSVEFIIANSQRMLWMKSFEIGGQRLMDRFHKHDPISSDDIHQLNVFLEKELTEVFTTSNQYDVKALIGSAGSFDTLQDMFLESGHQKSNVGMHELPIDYFQTICSDLITKNREERMKIPGMIAMRVDMIVVACLLIKLLVDKLRMKQIRVSEYALKEGILFGSRRTVGAQN